MEKDTLIHLYHIDITPEIPNDARRVRDTIIRGAK